jgi:hypothetical protein
MGFIYSLKKKVQIRYAVINLILDLERKRIKWRVSKQKVMRFPNCFGRFRHLKSVSS